MSATADNGDANGQWMASIQGEVFPAVISQWLLLDPVLPHPLTLAVHDGGAGGDASPEAWLVLLLVAAGGLYALGLMRLWKKAGTGRGIRKRDAICFAAGWLALVAALLTPLDALAARSFMLHMVQHELLMVVAAPLIVVSRPLEAWAWALPRKASRGLTALARVPVLTEPRGAWCFHAAALWLWHLPLLFHAALADYALHVLQHASFFVSALAFWWAVFGRAARVPDGMSIALLFTTMLHTGALGALITFAPTPWYADRSVAPLFGFTALEDQQLGGLVMWVPGGFAYLIVGLAIVARWLARPEPRAGLR